MIVTCGDIGALPPLPHLWLAYLDFWILDFGFAESAASILQASAQTAAFQNKHHIHEPQSIKHCLLGGSTSAIVIVPKITDFLFLPYLRVSQPTSCARSSNTASSIAQQRSADHISLSIPHQHCHNGSPSVQRCGSKRSNHQTPQR